jgi:hypothetical protein
MSSHYELADGRRIAVPRAAIWIGNFAASVYRVFESIGRSRGERAVRDAAARIQASDPKLAAQMRQALRSGPVRG